MTIPPNRPGQGPEWVDPDAPTGIAPQNLQRPASGGQPPIPPAAAPQRPHDPAPTAPQHFPPPPQQQILPPRAQPPGPGQAQPWPNHPGQAPNAAPWPTQPPEQATPWQGAPGPGMAYPGQQPYPGQPPAKNRKPLIIGLIAAAVVAVIVAVIGIAASSGGGDGGGMSASDTAKAYLEALSNGDAAKALSYGSAQPANTELLSDDILRKQLAKMPISNIRILDEDKSLAGIGQSSVHVAVNFGQVVNDVKMTLKQDSDKTWKLDTAAVKVDAPFQAKDQGSAEATVTLFGKSFKNGSLYVFPGYLDVGSSNEYVTATAEPILLDALQTYTSTTLDPQIGLNDDGRKAINAQVAAAFAKCQGSNLLAPPGCPTKADEYDAVEGTASWGPADLSGVTVGDLASYDMTVLLGGQAKMPLSYRTTAGDTKQGTAVAYVGGNADMTKTPPQLDFR